MDEINLKDLIAPCRLIDISEKCKLNRDYRLIPEDILHHESTVGSILPQGCIVIIRTGIYFDSLHCNYFAF